MTEFTLKQEFFKARVEAAGQTDSRLAEAAAVALTEATEAPRNLSHMTFCNLRQSLPSFTAGSNPKSVRYFNYCCFTLNKCLHICLEIIEKNTFLITAELA